MTIKRVSIEQWDEAAYARLLPEIGPEASKYARGSVLVAGGSARYSGAPILAARAAARAGAGYTSLMVPADMEQVARMHVLSIPVISAPSCDGVFDSAAAALPGELLSHLDALVVGPGMCATDATMAFTARVLDAYDAPVVLDADALNVIASARASGVRVSDADNVIYALIARASRGCTTVLTPHDGELRRLVDGLSLALDTDAERAVAQAMAPDMDEACAARLRRAKSLSGVMGAIVVAKGRQTLIVDQGQPVVVSSFGSPVLAKAGTGDVLAGIIGSLCAQGLSGRDAAALGVFIHSRAGESARKRLGLRAPMAEDVIEGIAPSLKALEALAG